MSPATPLAEAVRLVRDSRADVLVVCDQESVIGVLTANDLLRALGPPGLGREIRLMRSRRLAEPQRGVARDAGRCERQRTAGSMLGSEAPAVARTASMTSRWLLARGTLC